ncbi:MAG: methyltransferase type 12 [uncultured bacterium]|nr:MAG: methyltransferase type 12 [uncultured bacterium]
MSTLVSLIILAMLLPFLYFIYEASIKGVPFLPTPMKAAKKMLKLAKIKKGDIVIDIGCGDGRLVILADKLYQANAIGFELSPPIYFYAKLLNFFKKNETNAKILFADSRKVDLSKADAIVMYMLPKPLREFWKDKLEEDLKPTARVVSYAFSIQGWNHAHKEESIGEENIGPIYVYEMDKIY